MHKKCTTSKYMTLIDKFVQKRMHIALDFTVVLYLNTFVV